MLKKKPFFSRIPGAAKVNRCIWEKKGRKEKEIKRQFFCLVPSYDP